MDKEYTTWSMLGCRDFPEDLKIVPRPFKCTRRVTNMMSSYRVKGLAIGSSYLCEKYALSKTSAFSQ